MRTLKNAFHGALDKLGDWFDWLDEPEIAGPVIFILMATIFCAATTLVAVPIYYLLNFVLSFIQYKMAFWIAWLLSAFITPFLWNTSLLLLENFDKYKDKSM